MKLDASIEPTIGPYEVYEDEWFNAKAAFEAFITVRDDAETAKLAKFGGRAAGHREPPAHRSQAAQPEARGAGADPGGELDLLRRATPTAGCRPPPSTCPTTSASAQEMGTKRAMLKNVQEAKFKMVLVPISKVALVAGRPARTSPSTPSSPTS